MRIKADIRQRRFGEAGQGSIWCWGQVVAFRAPEEFYSNKLRPGLFSRILGLKDVKLSLKAAEIGERHLIQPRPVIATKDLAVVARMIKNSLKS